MALPVGNPERGVGGGDMFEGGAIVVGICYHVISAGCTKSVCSTYRRALT
jgi:hypothetical protein